MDHFFAEASEEPGEEDHEQCKGNALFDRVKLADVLFGAYQVVEEGFLDEGAEYSEV